MDTDLSKIIQSKQYMQKAHVQFVMYQLLCGLKHIHSANVIHRDLKPANILVSCTDCVIKIADFGLSRVVDREVIARETYTNHPLVLPSFALIDHKSIDECDEFDNTKPLGFVFGNIVNSIKGMLPNSSDDIMDVDKEVGISQVTSIPPPIKLKRNLTSKF